MTIQTTIWTPPSLCGCQLRITADWPEDQGNNTYRHPTPFTIKNIIIVNVCDNHNNINSMSDVSHLYETNPHTGKQFQQRGYLQHPIANPTQAQCLYQFLCSYNGQTHSFPCGCASHMWIDENGSATYLHKQEINRKCQQHINDAVDMRQAMADFNNNALQGAVAKAPVN